MKDYFDDLYKSIRDSIIDNGFDAELDDVEEDLMDEDEFYYNAVIRNFISRETASMRNEVADLEEKFGKEVAGIVDFAEFVPVLGEVQIPEAPEDGVLDVDDIIDMAFCVCSAEVERDKELKNEITYVKDELEEAGILYSLNGYNQVGLDALEKLREKIIAFYNEAMKANQSGESEKI